jgi:hypothetical protein
MNFNRAFAAAMTAIMVLGLLTLMGCCPATSHAADRTLNGSIAIETPIGQPDRVQDDSPMVKFDLHLNRFAGPVGLFGGANINLDKGLPWSSENKFWTGLEVPIGNRGLVGYGFFERRFDLNDNRFVVGARYNFHSGY